MLRLRDVARPAGGAGRAGEGRPAAGDADPSALDDPQQLGAAGHARRPDAAALGAAAGGGALLARDRRRRRAPAGRVAEPLARAPRPAAGAARIPLVAVAAARPGDVPRLVRSAAARLDAA